MKNILFIAVLTQIIFTPYTMSHNQLDFQMNLRQGTYENMKDDYNEDADESYEYLDSQWDNNVPKYENDISLYSEVPNKYPDNLEDFKNKYPDNRNQNPYGVCWAFSSLGLAEFDLINDGMADKNIDLSELQLAYFVFNSVIDPLEGTAGDSAKYYNDNTSTSYLNYGGNYQMASRRLLQWAGPISEVEVPYDNASAVLTEGLDDKYAYNYNVAHLNNVYRISLKQNTSDVKEQIMQHGAVGIMYYHDDFNLSTNTDGSEWNYYDTAASGGGHAVMIVGWDDTYSKDNFVWDKPSSDGAWLIRNSWGSYVDYFWMSYETASLQDAAWIFDFEVNDGYDNNYQLDGGLDVYTISYRTMANVFTASNKPDVKYEKLEAVSLSTLDAANVGYKIEVYTDLTDENNPLSGIKQESATTYGSTAYAGVYTIELNDEVNITPGSKFSVVVSVDKDALNCEQAVSIADGEDFSNMIWECTVSQGNRKTFYKYGDNFYAYPAGNLCVKAFTSNNYNNPDTPEKPSYIVDNIDYSLVFDADYYYLHYNDLANAFGKDDNALFNHFLAYGINEGRQACETFNPINYKNNYSDLVIAFGDDISKYYIHYIEYGMAEGRSGIASDFQDSQIEYIIDGVDYSIVFDINYYYSNYNDLANAFGKDNKALFNHFINYGIYEGRQANELFNVEVYKNRYDDLRNAFGSDISAYYVHYILYGKAEGRVAVADTVEPDNTYIYDGIDYSIVFDPDYYHDHYDDLANVFGLDKAALFSHFIEYGMSEGRQASVNFNVKNYMNRYNDLVTAYGNDMKMYYEHYLKYGISEGRDAS